jgi:HNH endonuclease
MQAELRTLVWDRARGRCDMCGQGLARNRWECHHRKLRSQGGPDEPHNLIALHARCHEQAHRNRDWARAHGYIVHPSADPATTPVWRHGQRWQLPVAGQWVGCPAQTNTEGAVA